MQPIERINAIETRARAINLGLKRVCTLAGVDYSRVWRWQKGQSQPLLANFIRVTGHLDDTLKHLEEQMRERLKAS